jgi:hypothetical protein
VGKGKRADIYLEVRKRRGAYIFPDFCMYLQINVFNLKI